MKERPILFSTEMVKAILQGRKTQTRRIVKPQPIGKVTYFKGEIWTDEPDVITSRTIKCPYGQPNDRLWVRETWARESFPNGTTARSVETLYLANGDKAVRWKPSIHMPKAAARIWLEVVSVRVERLNDISEKDAIAEGIELLPIYSFPIYRDYLETGIDGYQYEPSSYKSLWESINGPGSWDANPFVWVIEFITKTEPI